MSNDLLKPKNQTLEERKKRERIFIPEVHSAPELMPLAEKLEFAEEIVSELLGPYLDGLGGHRVEVADVDGSEIVLRALTKLGLEEQAELQSLVKEECQGAFSLRFI